VSYFIPRLVFRLELHDGGSLDFVGFGGWSARLTDSVALFLQVF
jgi:hypothetical protein